MPKNDYLSKADLKELLNDRINPEDTSIIIGAYEMAENAEAGETDPTGAPKFYHNTRVCRILIDELSVSAPELLITALLHNILSASSEITISIIDYNFGSYVAYLVQLISDDYAERKGDKAPAINIESIDDDALIIILSDCLDILRTFDFGKLIMDCEETRMIQHTIKGIEVADYEMAVDVIKAIGPGGEYMTHQHTYDNMKKMSRSKLFDRRKRDSWMEKTGGKDLTERAYEKALHVLETHKPLPLLKGAAQSMRSIIDDYEVELKKGCN